MSQELWAIKGPDGEYNCPRMRESEAWEEYIRTEYRGGVSLEQAMEWLREEGRVAVKVRIEEVVEVEDGK